MITLFPLPTRFGILSFAYRLPVTGSGGMIRATVVSSVVQLFCKNGTQGYYRMHAFVRILYTV